MPARDQGAFPAGCHKTQAVPGGHKGRPYGHASGSLVGAGFMPARDQVPLGKHPFPYKIP